MMHTLEVPSTKANETTIRVFLSTYGLEQYLRLGIDTC
jgi:hypothetical protein